MSTTTVSRQETEPLAGAPAENGLGARVWLAVAGIVAVTAAFMLPGIGSKSLWRDEGFTVSTVLRPWRSLAQLLAEHETNAWLHAVALKAWSGFGSSVGMLRTFSAVGVFLSIPVIALLANKLANRRVAVVAALLLACQGSVFFYGQQVRGYSFTVLFTLLTALAFSIEVRRPSNRALVGFVVASFALTSTNVVAITVVVCMVASLVALPAAQRQWRRRGIALGVVVALSLPVALLISTHNEGGLYEVGLGTLWDVLMVLTGRSGIVGIVGIGILGVVALSTTWRVFRHGGSTFERWVHAFCLLWVIGPFALAFVAALFKPVLSGRYMMICVPGICVYGAIGLVDFLSTWKTTDTVGRVLRAGAVAAVAVASLAGVALWLKGDEVEDWRGASELVFTEARQGDEVLFANDSVRLFFEYYRTRGDTEPTLSPTPAFPAEPWGEYETGDHQYVSFTADDVAGGRGPRRQDLGGRRAPPRVHRRRRRGALGARADARPRRDRDLQRRRRGPALRASGLIRARPGRVGLGSATPGLAPTTPPPMAHARAATVVRATAATREQPPAKTASVVESASRRSPTAATATPSPAAASTAATTSTPATARRRPSPPGIGPVPDGPVPDGPVPVGSVPVGSVPDGSVPDGPVPVGARSGDRGSASSDPASASTAADQAPTTRNAPATSLGRWSAATRIRTTPPATKAAAATRTRARRPDGASHRATTPAVASTAPWPLGSVFEGGKVPSTRTSRVSTSCFRTWTRAGPPTTTASRAGTTSKRRRRATTTQEATRVVTASGAASSRASARAAGWASARTGNHQAFIASSSR